MLKQTMGLLSTLFGKRRKKTKKSKRPPAALRKLCKKLGVKLTLKRGHRRVYKSVRQLKKQCHSKLKARKSKFGRGHCRPGFRRVHNRRGRGRCCRRLRNGRLVCGPAGLRRRRLFAFGSGAPLSPGSTSAGKYISPGAPEYSSVVRRGAGIFGVGKPFFNKAVPNAYPASWYYNIQPDGSTVAVGSPFGSYTTPLKKYV